MAVELADREEVRWMKASVLPWRPASQRCAWTAATAEFSIRWGDAFEAQRGVEMQRQSAIISPYLQ